MLDDPPSYSAVRSTLRILTEKGLLRHHREGLTYHYSIPRRAEQEVRRSAVERLLGTVFRGSAHDALVTLIDSGADDLTADQIAALRARLDQLEKDRG